MRWMNSLRVSLIEDLPFQYTLIRRTIPPNKITVLAIVNIQLMIIIMLLPPLPLLMFNLQLILIFFASNNVIDDQHYHRQDACNCYADLENFHVCTSYFPLIHNGIMFLIFSLPRCSASYMWSYKFRNIRITGAIKIKQPIMMNVFTIGNTSKSFDISLYS